MKAIRGILEDGNWEYEEPGSGTSNGNDGEGTHASQLLVGLEEEDEEEEENDDDWSDDDSEEHDSDDSDEAEEDDSDEDEESNDDEPPDEEPSLPSRRSLRQINKVHASHCNPSDASKEVSPSESSTSSSTKRKRTIRFNKVVEVGTSGHQMLAGSSDEESEDEKSDDVQMALVREETPEPESRKNKKRKLAQNTNIPDEEPPKKVAKRQKHQEMDAPVHEEPNVIPGEGKGETHARNTRRREAKRLKKLKASGVLPAHATREDLRYYLQQNEEEGGFANDEHIKERRDALLSRAKSSDSQTTNSVMEASEMVANFPAFNTIAAASTLPEEVSSEPLDASDSPTQADAAKRRSRLDLASSRRLLFGSLGVRNPRTKADEDVLREKFAKPPKVGPHIGSNYIRPNATVNGVKNGDDQVRPGSDAVIAQDTETPPNSDAWKAKIRLSAVECIDEGVQLSEPPYPFKQCWDEQYAYTQPKKNKKRKRRETNDAYEEVEDTSTLLDYDEEYPPIPDDVSQLPTFTPDHDNLQLYLGALIAFKQLEVSAATNWAPQISDWKSARIDSCNKKHVTLVLAPRNRDIQDKSEEMYDEKGRRLLSKFEMPDENTDEIDDGYRSDIAWDELVELKLIMSRPQVNGVAEPPNGITDDMQGNSHDDSLDEAQDTSATAVEVKSTDSDLSLPNGDGIEVSVTA